MPTIEMQTAEGVSLRLDVAGAGSRFAAGLLDGFLIGAVFAGVLIFLQLLASVDVTGLTGFALGLVAMGGVLFFVLYHVAFHVAWNGQTPGKVALRLRVVGAEGHPPTAMQVLLRGLLWILDVFLFVPVPLGVIVIAVTERRQRIGDLVAGTLVVREEPAGGAFEPWARETWGGLGQHQLGLSPVAAGRFDAEDFAFLREVVTRRGLDLDERRRLYRRVARHYLMRLDLGPGGDPRVILKELYLFLREHRPT